MLREEICRLEAKALQSENGVTYIGAERLRAVREIADVARGPASLLTALGRLIGSCEQVAWTQRSMREVAQDAYWSFVPTDEVKRARVALENAKPEPIPFPGDHPSRDLPSTKDVPLMPLPESLVVPGRVKLRSDAAHVIRPMVEAYRLWATGRMDASRFGEIADRAVVAYDEEVRSAEVSSSPAPEPPK
jgi:hypothetical protein